MEHLFKVVGGTIVALYALGIWVNLLEIGQPREPISPEDAARTTAIGVIIIAWTIWAIAR